MDWNKLCSWNIPGSKSGVLIVPLQPATQLSLLYFDEPSKSNALAAIANPVASQSAEAK